MRGHWYVDITYTNTRRDVTGITRTARRLVSELQIATHRCTPVVFHSSGFRKIHNNLDALNTDAAQIKQSPFFSKSNAVISGNFSRLLITVLLKISPWVALRFFWKIISTAVFNLSSKGFQKVDFSPGDVLFLADASWNYPSWKVARLARQQGAKVVTLIYDLMPIRHPEYCFPLLPPQFQSWLTEILTCSDAVICISRTTRDDLLSWLNEQPLGNRSPNLPIGYFHLGVDLENNLENDEVRPFIRNFFSSAEPCFASIGSFEAKRNYPFILRVFEELWQKGTSIRLLLAGRATAEYAEFLTEIKGHTDYGNKLLVLQDASDAEISYIYQQCRCLIMASSFEGFGLPLIEARSRGTIVIANQIPSFQEISDPGVFFFDLKYPISLRKLILEHSRTDYRDQFEPLIPTTWRQSAMSCQSTIKALLWKSSAPSKDPN